MNRALLLMGGKVEKQFFMHTRPTNKFRFKVATFNSYGGIVDWGDGTFRTGDLNTPEPSYYKDYSDTEARTVTTTVNGGLKEISGLHLFNCYNLIIEDFGEFLSPFPKLKLIHFSVSTGSGVPNSGAVVLKGNLHEIPDTVETFNMISLLTTSRSLYILDLDKFSPTSNLRVLSKTGAASGDRGFNVTGDFANLPPNMEDLNFGSPSSRIASIGVTYTGGRVWKSEFASFVNNAFALTSTENDNLLIDLANSVTTAIGSKTISLRGARTSASDSAVLYLEGLGFTVTIVP